MCVNYVVNHPVLVAMGNLNDITYSALRSEFLLKCHRPQPTSSLWTLSLTRTFEQNNYIPTHFARGPFLDTAESNCLKYLMNLLS